VYCGALGASRHDRRPYARGVPPRTPTVKSRARWRPRTQRIEHRKRSTRPGGAGLQDLPSTPLCGRSGLSIPREAEPACCASAGASAYSPCRPPPPRTATPRGTVEVEQNRHHARTEASLALDATLREPAEWCRRIEERGHPLERSRGAPASPERALRARPACPSAPLGPHSAGSRSVASRRREPRVSAYVALLDLHGSPRRRLSLEAVAGKANPRWPRRSHHDTASASRGI